MKHIYITACSKDGGIYHYTFADKKLTFCEKLPLDRAMYTVIRDKTAYILLRDTGNGEGGLVRYHISDGGALENPDEVMPSHGVVPCHLCVKNDNVYLVNYLSGNVVKMPDKVVTHSGVGVNLPRQDAPHTHFVTFSPDGKYLLCTDLGLDTVFVYDGGLNEVSRAKVPAGSGCRHLCFGENGRLVYCVNELSSDVSVFSFDNGKLELLDTYEAIPDFEGRSTAAAIRLYNGFLYVSHRGADCISRFKVVGDGLELLENTPCGGSDPRDFDIADNVLFCANEGGSIGIISLEDGKPALVDSVELSGDPLCVSFFEN